LGIDISERLRQPWQDIEQRNPKSGGAWPLPTTLGGIPLLVERADRATILVRLAWPDHTLPTAAEVVSDKPLESCRRPTQEVEHGLEALQEGALTIRELIALTHGCAGLRP
jgi:hypothetical protein